jgi:Protein of unknown function (DUF3465)
MFNTRRRSSSSYNRGPTGRRPQWLVIAAGVATLINTLLRLFKMFKGKGGSTSTSSPDRSAPVGQAPAGRSVDVRRGEPQISAPTPAGSDGGIPALFKKKQSDTIVQASGEIVKILPDETDTSDGSGMHQKFLVELADKDRTTIKIAHNLDFGRVPVREGDIVAFRGEYEWTEHGGTVHWTHHDPGGRHPGGWIEFNGKRYE